MNIKKQLEKALVKTKKEFNKNGGDFAVGYGELRESIKSIINKFSCSKEQTAEVKTMKRIEKLEEFIRELADMDEFDLEGFKMNHNSFTDEPFLNGIEAGLQMAIGVLESKDFTN